MREAERSRETRETRVRAAVSIGAEPASDIRTGVRMFDHLLGQFAFHAGLRLTLAVQSSDGILHHAIEDAAITLGSALDEALGDRAGIARYGQCILPMDDALVRVALDLGGRFYARTTLGLCTERIEDLETVMISHVIGSFASNARATVHVDRLAGDDPHHVAEAAFKALGRACAQAWSIDPAVRGVASTKGLLV